MTKHNRLARCLAAALMCGALVGTMSATSAAATPAPVGSEAGTSAPADAKVKLHAKLLDTKVMVNGKARIRGRLDLDARQADQRALEPVVVQRLVAGVWVDVLTSTCLPNDAFRLKVSFSISAQYSLRLFHPTTAVSSDVFVLTVL